MISVNPAEKTNHQFLARLLIIGLTALLMRVVMGEAIKPIRHHDGMTPSYFAAAINLFEHGVLSEEKSTNPKPTSLRMPLYSIYLASVRAIAGPHQWENWVIAIHYIMGALICVLIALLGAQLMENQVGTVAGFLAAFSIELYYFSIVISRDNMALFVLLLYLNSFVRFLKTKNTEWILLSAFVFGLAILLRPEILLIGLLLSLFFLKDIKEIFIVKTFIAMARVALAALPWAIWIARNFIIHGKLILLSTEGAWAFYMGQVFPPQEAYTVADPTAMKIIGSTPIEYDWFRYMNHEATQAIIQHPIRNFGWGVVKIGQTFIDYSKNGLSLLVPLLWIAIPWLGFKNSLHRRTATIIGSAIAALFLMLGQWDFSAPIGLLHIGYNDVFFLGVIGLPLFILRKPKEPWQILAAPFLTLVIANVLYVAHYRQRIYLFDWVLILCAAYALIELVKYLQAKLLFVSKAKSI
jgi:hypothetical protein